MSEQPRAPGEQAVALLDNAAFRPRAGDYSSGGAIGGTDAHLGIRACDSDPAQLQAQRTPVTPALKAPRKSARQELTVPQS
jgi:hypothetical protein